MRAKTELENTNGREVRGEAMKIFPKPKEWPPKERPQGAGIDRIKQLRKLHKEVLIEMIMRLEHDKVSRKED